MDYLGQVIRPGKIATSDKETDAIRGLMQLTNVTELKSFLGLCNVFHRFVPNFAWIAAALQQANERSALSLDGLDEMGVQALSTLQSKW